MLSKIHKYRDSIVFVFVTVSVVGVYLWTI
jgi:hypothetical protein